MADTVIRPAADEHVDPAYAVLEACSVGPWFELTREQFREWWPTYKQIWIAEEHAIVARASARGEAVEVPSLEILDSEIISERVITPNAGVPQKSEMSFRS